MLVLSRKKAEAVVIDGGIKITVLEVRGNVVRLGIEAPSEVPILRSELCERNQELAASVIGT
jgi:carbon storage regulator